MRSEGIRGRYWQETKERLRNIELGKFQNKKFKILEIQGSCLKNEA